MTLDKKDMKKNKKKKELKLIRAPQIDRNQKIPIITKDAVLNETFLYSSCSFLFIIFFILWSMKSKLKVISIFV